tara:strand:- start:968 stop:1138 length:171 start_codon:yes stop_codon:yes gene_type:complete
MPTKTKSKSIVLLCQVANSIFEIAEGVGETHPDYRELKELVLSIENVICILHKEVA